MKKRTVFQLIEPEVEAFAAFLNSTNFPIYKYRESKVGY